MATVTKDFKVKAGLIVEGATATVNNHDILTKKQDDQDYIVNLIGGTATSVNTPDTVVKRDGNGNFAAGTVTADLVGDVTGNVVGNVTGDVTGNVTGTVSSLSNHDTGDLAEGTNLYFTNARAQSAVASDIATAKSEAIADAALDATTKANAAEVAAKAYADGLATNYDAAGAAATAQSNANAYTDTAVANLVDSAPAMLDTLNELAAAIADNPNYASDVTNLIATKADTTYVDSADQTTLNNAKAYADGLAVNYDASGSAQLAQTNAETYASGLVGQEVIDRDSAITAAVNALNTDVIEEGTVNLYFTNQRAIDAVGGTIGDAINLLTTDDIEEGSSNLYFTDARAVSALEAVVPDFTEIDINSVVTKVAATTTVATASQVTAHQFANTAHRSAEYLVKVAYGSHTELSKVMITLDSSDNVAITEYAVVGTNGSASTISADVNAGNVRLLVTTANNNSVVTVAGTLI
jgi:hypothetical protein